MNNKVWILSSKKIDGRYNKGIIVGLEKEYDYLSYSSDEQYFKDFKLSRIKVAYIDVSTKKASQEWFSIDKLSKTNPVNELK